MFLLPRLQWSTTDCRYRPWLKVDKFSSLGLFKIVESHLRIGQSPEGQEANRDGTHWRDHGRGYGWCGARRCADPPLSYKKTLDSM